MPRGQLRPPVDATVQRARRVVSSVTRKYDQYRQWVEAHTSCRWCPESNPACFVVQSLDPGQPASIVREWIRQNYRWTRIQSFLDGTCLVLCLNCRAKYRAQVQPISAQTARLRDARDLAHAIVSADRKQLAKLNSDRMRARWADPNDPIQHTRARLHSPEHMRKMRDARGTK
jgi:hypothetical protein